MRRDVRLWLLFGIVIIGTAANVGLSLRAPSRTEPEWQSLPEGLQLKLAGHSLLPAAPDTVWFFSDYQCQACRRFWNWLRRGGGRGGDGLHVRLLAYPHMGPSSLAAAQVGECAAMSGKLVDFTDRIFALKGPLNPEVVLQVGLAVTGVDSTTLRACMDADATVESLQAARALHGAIGANGTPVIVLGRRFLNGVPVDIGRTLGRGRQLVDSLNRRTDHDALWDQ